jgi:hypothetical protein
VVKVMEKGEERVVRVARAMEAMAKVERVRARAKAKTTTGITTTTNNGGPMIGTMVVGVITLVGVLALDGRRIAKKSVLICGMMQWKVYLQHHLAHTRTKLKTGY